MTCYGPSSAFARPQDAQQLKTACAALEIETGIIDNTTASELPANATNRPVP